MKTYLQAFKKYIVFSSRATRREFLVFTLANLIIVVGGVFFVGFIDRIFDASSKFFVLAWLLFLLSIIIPTISVTARRLHDANWSGWWVLAMFVPVIGWFLLIILLLLASKEISTYNKPKPVWKKIIKIFFVLLGILWAVVFVSVIIIAIMEGDTDSKDNNDDDIKISQEGNITNLETAGNLKVTHELKCLSPQDIKPEYTPADLMPVVVDCIDKEKYEDALQIFMAASLYGSYDKHRVKDNTAHQAISVLIAKHIQFLDTPNKKEYNTLVMELIEEGKDEKNNSVIENHMCEFISKLPRPNYFPSYMISHGMDAFSPDFVEKDGVVKDYNPEKTWQKVLEENWEICYK